MAGRHHTWRRLRGDSGRPDLAQYGNKLLGYLAEQRRMGGSKSQTITRQLPDGSVVRARYVGDQPVIEISTAPAPPGGIEEIIHLFASSPGGLRIFDLGSKTLVRTVTGVEAYDLHAVSRDGDIAWMGYAPAFSNPSAIVARVDLANNSAFGYSYAANTPNAGGTTDAGLAIGVDAITQSPDDALILVHFSGSGTTGGVVREGVGGVILADSETLVPIRPPIRMTFEPAPFAWRPDGERFFLAASKNDDVGDAPTNARLTALTESTTDYVAAFDKDGLLLGSRLLVTWATAPDAGFSRSIKAIVATNDRLYVSARDFDANTRTLYVLDAATTSMNVLGSFDLTATLADAPSILCLTRGGTRLRAATGTRILEFDVENATPSLLYNVAKPEYATLAPSRAESFDALQLGPKSRLGRPPDDRQFFMNYDTIPTPDIRVLRAYRKFEAGSDDPVYEFDLAEWETDLNYRLAVVGNRATIAGSR